MSTYSNIKSLIHPTVRIHNTAIIEDGARIDENSIIGPYSIIGRNVTLGKNNILKSHVVMMDCSIIIGDNNQFFPFVSFNITQDKKYQGEASEIMIGNNNVFREYSTVNSGTKHGGLITKIGNNGLFMMSCHVAHDCNIGDEVILANNVALAGHVTVGNYVTIGGQSAVHQWTRIGDYAMIGGMSAITDDIIPYGMAVGDRASLAGLNVVGLKRRGFGKDTLHEIRHAYEMIFGVSSDLTFAQRLEMAKEEFKDSIHVKPLIDFILAETSRVICKPKQTI